MKIFIIISNLSQWLLVGFMSWCGVLSLINSGFYDWLQKLTVTHYPQVEPFIPAIIWGALFIFGILTIIFGKQGVGALTFFAILVSLPSILSFNSLDLLKIFGGETEITTRLNFFQTLLLAMAIMISYGLLTFMIILRKSRLNWISRQIPAGDIEYVIVKNHKHMLLAILLTCLIAIIIGGVSVGLGKIFSNYFPETVWYAILIGLGCILILGIYLYWLGTRKRIVA